MKINLYCAQDLSTLKVFDFYYAYCQAIRRDNNYQSTVEITLTTDPITLPDCLNVAVIYMPEHSVEFYANKFDVVLLDNQHHPLEICTEEIYNSIQKYPNCYFINGAILTDDYTLRNKFVYVDIDTSRDYSSQPQYPQYYERNCFNSKIRQPMVFVNGQNRTNRQYYIDHLPVNVPYKNTWPEISKTRESFFEDEHDRTFREFINESYNCIDNTAEWSQNEYYAKSVQLGINGKFGTLPPGYFFVDEYFDYQCIIYPETCWLNNQTFISEKIGKCVSANTIPWPIGGSNINKLYNSYGYQTAWNLLPDVLKLYDSEHDHFKRVKLWANAVDWASQNPDIWKSDQARNIINNNKVTHFSPQSNVLGVQTLDKIFKEAYERRY